MVHVRRDPYQNNVDQTPSWLQQTTPTQQQTTVRYDPTYRPPTVTQQQNPDGGNNNKNQNNNRNNQNNNQNKNQNNNQNNNQTTPTEQQTTPSAPTVTTPDYTNYLYDPSSNEAYNLAMESLTNARGARPEYQATYDSQLTDLYEQIVGREKFKYDMNEDMLYQQAQDRAIQLGQMAMMDTMGQAAALTGGYGNTYAQSVGQQAYQGYLQQLNDNLPEYYQAALDAYNAEGDRMLTQYSLLGDLADREYGRYRDETSDYWQNLSYWQGVADNEYDRGYNNWYNAYQMSEDEEDDTYARQNEGYDRLVTMITTLGYEPTPEELAAVGMSQEHADAYLNYYNNQNSSRSPSGPTQTYDPNEILENTKDAVRNGTYTYTEAWDVIDAAHREGYITDAQRSAFLQEIYQEVRN